MPGKEPDEDRGERTETGSSEEDAGESYAQPDFETLGSIAAIGELMRRGQGHGEGGRGNGRGDNGRDGDNGRGRGPSGGI